MRPLLPRGARARGASLLLLSVAAPRPSARDALGFPAPARVSAVRCSHAPRSCCPLQWVQSKKRRATDRSEGARALARQQLAAAAAAAVASATEADTGPPAPLASPVAPVATAAPTPPPDTRRAEAAPAAPAAHPEPSPLTPAAGLVGGSSSAARTPAASLLSPPGEKAPFLSPGPGSEAGSAGGKAKRRHVLLRRRAARRSRLGLSCAHRRVACWN